MLEWIVAILSPHVFEESGLVVCTHPNTEDVLVYSSEGIVREFSEGVFTQWLELPEEAQMFWYSFIVDNEQLITSYLRENVVEFDNEFLEKHNAQEIKADDGQIVGRIVEVPTIQGEETITSLVFYSADLSFATLTAWSSTDTESRKTAGEDVKRIAEELQNYYNTYFRDETETEQD